MKPGHHGTTFGGNPVACRLGAVVVEETERLLPQINTLGAWFGAELRRRNFGEVRGSGLMWGIELDRPATAVARELLEHGFVVGTAREKVLRLLPPYIVPKKALIEFMDALTLVLTGHKEKAA